MSLRIVKLKDMPNGARVKLQSGRMITIAFKSCWWAKTESGEVLKLGPYVTFEHDDRKNIYKPIKEKKPQWFKKY